jgi:hypothetical protein
MISRICLFLALGLVVAACADLAAFDYRVVSKDPKVTPERMLLVVNRSIERLESTTSAPLSSFARVDEKTGEVTFGLGATGSGKTPSIRNTESRLLKDLRYEFGDRVEVFCNGDRLRWDGTVEPQAPSAPRPSAQEEPKLGP